MVVYCAVKGCRKNSRHNGEHTFFRLPQNSKLREKWSEFAGIINSDKKVYVCIDHFEPKYIWKRHPRCLLAKGSIPTLKPGNTATSKLDYSDKDKDAVVQPSTDTFMNDDDIRPSTENNGIEMDFDEAPSPVPSSSNTQRNAFDFKNRCIYCGILCDANRRRHLMRQVQDKSLIDRIINVAKRTDNILGTEVLGRLHGITCLVNEGARYHIKCATSFFAVPKSERPSSSRSALIHASVDAVCEYIETSGKFEFTTKELQDQCKQYSVSNQTLYQKLTEKYGTDIFIHHVRGKPSIVYYKHFDIGYLCMKYYSGENLQEQEKLTIFKVAADLLRKDIKNHEYKIDSYSQASEFLNNVDDDIPESLMNFLGLLLETDHSEDAEPYEIKSSCIAHSIIKCIRGSTFVSALQLGLGTYIYRKTGSRQIIDLLNKIGVCSSYHHVVQFENSVVMHSPKMTIEKGVRVQHGDSFIQDLLRSTKS